MQDEEDNFTSHQETPQLNPVYSRWDWWAIKVNRVSLLDVLYFTYLASIFAKSTSSETVNSSWYLHQFLFVPVHLPKKTDNNSN